MKKMASASMVMLLLALFLLVSLNSLNYYRGNLGSIDRRLQNTGESDRKPVIVVLITENTSLSDLCLSLKTLVNAKGDLAAQILAFHVETTPTLEEQNTLTMCTDRQISFALIPLHNFPVGYVPKDGVDYTAAHINRFWSSGIWNHTLLEHFDVIMKIDDTSCLSMENENLPNFLDPAHVYKAHIFPGTVEQNAIRVNGMHEFALNYMTTNSMIPLHNALWQRIHYTWHQVRTLPKFEDSFEVIDKHFMQRKDVNDWLIALTDEPPYGYYDEGWNVDSERILTMSMFGSVSSVDTGLVQGFMEKDILRNRRNHKICTIPFE